MEKELINIRKHGIDFTLLRRCSMIRTSLSLKDRIDDHSGEQRWHAIGVASFDEEAALLVVAHVYRGQNEEEIIRIISAREAGKRERRLYIQ